MEEQPYLGTHPPAPWPPGGPPPPALPQHGAPLTPGSWISRTPADIAQIVQRLPATWKPAERDRLFEWVLQEKLPGLVRFAYGALHVYAPGATLADAREAVAEKI